MQDQLLTIVRFRKRPVGAVVAIKDPTGKVMLGWSKCITHPTYAQREQGIEPDKFSKKKAVASALGRTNSLKYALTVGRAENVHQHNFPLIPSIIRKSLREMAARARRYFKDGVFEEVLTSEEREIALQDPYKNKIRVIKAIRERTGLGLREAKDLYEKYFPQSAPPPPAYGSYGFDPSK